MNKRRSEQMVLGWFASAAPATRVSMAPTAPRGKPRCCLRAGDLQHSCILATPACRMFAGLLPFPCPQPTPGLAGGRRRRHGTRLVASV